MNNKSSNRSMKRKIQPVNYSKKLRSKHARRRRSQISPILFTSKSPIDFPLDSSSSSYLTREVSCNSSRVSVVSDHLIKNKPRSNNLRKRELDEKIQGEQFRRITRSYYRQIESERAKERKGVNRDGEVELSESSCVESCCVAEARVLTDTDDSKLKSRTDKGAENAEETKGDEESEAITRSDISCVGHFSGGEIVKGTENSSENKEIDVISMTSSAVQFQNACSSIDKLSDKNRVSTTISNSDSTTEQKQQWFGNDSDLACSEHLSYDDVSEYSSSHDTIFSELQSQPETSEIDFSDYTPSLWFESGSEFSERSVGDSAPSPTFSLFLQYSEQFTRSTSALTTKVSSRDEDDYSDEFNLLRFEDEEDEESYQRFRNRERRQVYLHDYAEEYYSSATESGDLVVQQRLQMVHWIVEQSATKELQNETLFLGVSLLDRFLSRGFFKTKKNLQIVGIACLTLATRMEENQPLNSVRQKMFYIGNNKYSRCEVVAMEWLVQEVLNFQCFLPTIYNFLWFYLKAARANEEVEKRAKYLAVLALLDHEQLHYWSSTVAAGLVILASLAANQDASCQRVMETHVRTKDDDLPECIKSLEWLVKYVC